MILYHGNGGPPMCGLRVLRRAGLVCAPLLLPLLHADSQVVAAAAGPRVAVVEAGVELVLTVQGRTYPRNAVIRAVLRVKNVTRHPVELQYGCPNGPLSVEVLNATGAVVYPPAVPLLARPTCPPRPNGGPRLAPGQVMEERPYVLLRGSQVDAVAAVGPYNTQVFTPTLKLRLVAAPAPRVTLHAAGRIYATVVPPAPVRGPLLVSQSYRCQNGLTESSIAAWQATWKEQIRPGCAHVVEWHAVAGWLNQPVAFIAYLKR